MGFAAFSYFENADNPLRSHYPRSGTKSLGKGGDGGPGEGEETTLFKGFFLPFPRPPEAKKGGRSERSGHLKLSLARCYRLRPRGLR
jgi:hypothetical protein